MSGGGDPVYTMICRTGDVSDAMGSNGPLTSGVGTTGSPSDTDLPLRTSRAPLAPTSSVIRLSVPRSSSTPQRPQLVGNSSGSTVSPGTIKTL